MNRRRLRITLEICLGLWGCGLVSPTILPEKCSFDTKVEIVVIQERVFTRQPVWVNLRILNRSGEGPRIGGIPFETIFQITDSEGNRYGPVASFESQSTGPRMKPGELRAERVNIIKPYYRLGKRDPYLMPGDYRASILWTEDGYEALVSNTVRFKVEDPEGDEYDALQLLNDGDTKYRLKRQRQSDAAYEKLLRKYPRSLYAPNALMLLLRNHAGRYEADDKKMRIRAAKQLLEEYSDRYFNCDFVMYQLEECYRSNGNLSGLKDYLERLMSQPIHPETKHRVSVWSRRIQKD